MNHSYPITRQKTSLWVDLLIVVLGIAGMATFFMFYDRALPSASVNVTISRSQAEQIARDYLEQFGYAPKDYKFALSFQGRTTPCITSSAL